MPIKKMSIVLSLLPTVAAMGLMYKMGLDQEVTRQEYKKNLGEIATNLNEYKRLEGNMAPYCTSIEECPKEIDAYVSTLKEKYHLLENELIKTSENVGNRDNEISSLRKRMSETLDELKRTQESLLLTKQTVDAQISIEMNEVNNRIDDIHQSYSDRINELQSKLKMSQEYAQQEVAKKEIQFKEIHKKSVNNLLGMVDSLAKERETRLIPLIAKHDDKTVHDDYICKDESDIKPSEMIFSKHMDRHWMTWPVVVSANNTRQLTATTEHGYVLKASWENPENMYDLEEGDNISIQFLLDKDQSCDTHITARRTVLTTH